MGRENNGQMLGGGVVTSDNLVTWNYVHIVALKNTWHHVVMTYDGAELLFFLDNQKQSGNFSMNVLCKDKLVFCNFMYFVLKCGDKNMNKLHCRNSYKLCKQ